MTKIEDIEIDFSTEIPRSKIFEVTTESVQKSEYSDIATHIKSIMPAFVLECAFNQDDREEKFRKLMLLADKKGTVTLEQREKYDNLVITKIEETGRWENIITFNIEFQVVNTVEFQNTVAIKLTSKQKLQPTTKQNLQNTKDLTAEEKWLKQ